MAKKIKAIIKLNLAAGKATPAPPVGPALGQHGVPIMDFINQYNTRTAKLKGEIIPAVITVYQDRSFEFVTKLSPVAEMIKKEISLAKGSAKPQKDKVGKLTKVQAEKIAKKKMPDLNTDNLEAAVKIVYGTAKSMGLEIKN